MQTSRWPHAQMRLMAPVTLPRLFLVKHWNPRYRSSSSIESVAVRIGNVATISRSDARDVQQNIGMRRYVIAGARTFGIVVISLTPDSRAPTPDTSSDRR